MATPNPGGGGAAGRGGGGDGGGAGEASGSGGSVDGGGCGWLPPEDGVEGEICGSSNPISSSFALIPAATAAFAKAVKDNPSQSSRFTYSFGGVDLDDDVLEVRIHLDGLDNLEREISRSDITYMKLLAMIEGEGYGISDSMYHVKDDGEGQVGYELIDGMGKVLQMVDRCQDKHCIELIVCKGKNKPCAAVKNPYEKQVPICQNFEDTVYAVDDEGVISPSKQGISQLRKRGVKRKEILFVSDSENDGAYLLTQQSNNLQKGKNVCVEETNSDTLSEFDGSLAEESEDGFEFDGEQYRQDEHDAQLKQEKLEIKQRLKEMKRARNDPQHHIEGDTSAEELFMPSDEDSDSDCMPEPVVQKVKKIPVRKGPTDRCHYSQEVPAAPYYIPSSDSGSDGDLKEEDDDGAQIGWALPNRRSTAKKRKPRVWYDENRLSPEEQLRFKMCFTDVYQFRRAVQGLHIAQLRNFRYHRNAPNRVIVWCKERDTQKCMFHMNGSVIGKEKTFCLRKLNLQHTCATTDKCKVTGKWVAKLCEKNMRMDPGTTIGTVMETVKEKYGVTVKKAMAYRARKSCSHAICAIQKAYQQPHDFVHDFFKKSMYLETYNPVIYPVPSQEQWTGTDTPDVDPPVFKVEKGRVQTKRRRGKFEPPQPRETSRMATITCSNCNLQGHRYTNCTQTLQPHLQMRKNRHQSNMSEGSSAPAAAASSTTTAATACPRATSAAPRAAAAAPRATSAAERPAAAAPRAASAAPTATSAAPRAPAATRTGRQVKVTGRMEGYLNAGRWSSYKKPSKKATKPDKGGCKAP